MIDYKSYLDKKRLIAVCECDKHGLFIGVVFFLGGGWCSGRGATGPKNATDLVLKCLSLETDTFSV
jgi:hypothetical protein